MSEKPPKHKSGKKSRKNSMTPKPVEVAFPEPEPVCPTHNKPYRYYSDSSGQLLCEDCQLQTAKGTSQRLIPIEEAFRYNLANLYNAMNTQLFAKREALHGTLKRFEWAVQDITQVKKHIETDMKTEFSALQERLHTAAGSKEAVLEHELESLKSDIERINFIIASVEKSSNDQISFLKNSAQIKEAVDIAITKPFSTDIHVQVDDLPLELSKVREIANEYAALQALVAFKDKLIWNLVQEKASKQSCKGEIAEWATLTEKMSSALKKINMVCKFCNCLLDPDTVNSDCPENLDQGHFFIAIS